MAAPTLVFSFRFMRSTRLASSGKGPRLQGSLRSLCFCFSVATNPSILLFARYFRFSSEQYPLSVRTSSGFCPDCSWIALIRGLCLLQQLLHFLPQPLLGLLHPSITHGLVLARVGFYFAPIQSHSSQLQRSHL